VEKVTLSWTGLHTDGYTGMTLNKGRIRVDFAAILLNVGGLTDNAQYEIAAKVTYGGAEKEAAFAVTTYLTPQVRETIEDKLKEQK